MPTLLAGEIPKQFVQKRALEIRKKYFQHSKSPQDAFSDIFNDLNGTIEYVKTNKKRETLCINSDCSFTIYLPLSSSGMRDNFTIAHELGHFFLHTECAGKEKLVFNRGASNRKEWEANWFAAELLMPEKEFKEAAKTLCYDEYELGLHFGVSSSAAAVRLSSLNLKTNVF